MTLGKRPLGNLNKPLPKSLSKPQKKRLGHIGSLGRLGSMRVMDTLSKKPTVISKPKPKRAAVYVAELQPRVKDEVQELLDELEGDTKDRKATGSRRDRERRVAERKSVAKSVTKELATDAADEGKTIEETYAKTKADIAASSGIFDDSVRTENVQKKYSELGFSPAVSQRADLEQAVEKYAEGVARAVFKDRNSHFYNAAREFALKSKRPFMTDEELISLRRQIYHGYLGMKRLHVIAKHVDRILGDEVDRMLASKDRVVQFWQKKEFVLYVLAPEVVARIVAEEQHVDLSVAYRKMEATGDYGMYLMDKEEV